MKRKALQLLAICGVMVFIAAGCTENSDFTVAGTVSGADGQMIYLENVGVSSVETLDSASRLG